MYKTNHGKSHQTLVQIGVLVFALLILPITLIAINNRTSQKVSAAPGNAELSIQPIQQQFDVNDTGTFNIRIDPNGEDVSSVEIYLDYDPSIIQINSISPGNFFTDPQNQGQVGAPQVIISTTNNGQIHYAIGFPLGSNYSSNQFGYIANVNFTALSNGTSPLTIIGSGSPSSMVADISAQNVIDTNNINNGQITVGTSQPTTTPGSNSSLTLNNLSISNPQTVGEPFTVDLIANTDGQDISGIDAHIIFDKSFLNITSVRTTGPDIATEFNSYPAPILPLDDENSAGEVIISANIGISDPAVPANGSNLKIAELTFTPIAATTSTQLSILYTGPEDRNDSNIVKYIVDSQATDSEDILGSISGPINIAINNVTPPTATPTPTDAPTPTPTEIVTTPTPTPTNQPVDITTKLLLQGRVRTNANKQVDVEISYRPFGTTGTPTTININTQTNGDALFSLLPGNYEMLVKVPGYLAKKFPTTGNGAITINTGLSSQVLDLTTFGPLLGGDFNDDGIVNEIDYTLNSGFFGKFLTNDAIVDLDGSGQVNNLDFGIMRANWFESSDTL